MNSRKNASKNTKRNAIFCVFCAFSCLSFSAFILGAAENESTPSDYLAISYYNDHCARCHGPDGVNYDLKHLAQNSDEKLRVVIGSMAENQGQAPLDKNQVEIQLAYHRSFLDGKPFLILNSVKVENENLILRGEVTPESKVQVCVGEKTYAAKTEEQSWTAILPTDADWKKVSIIAVKGNVKTELKASAGFSHRP